MKFIAWILSVTSRHASDIYRYEKGGKGVRVLIIVLSLLFVGLTVAAEILTINLFITMHDSDLDHPFIAFFGALLLFIALFAATVDYCGCFSYVGFKMALRGGVLTAARRADIRRKKQRGEEITTADTTPDALETYRGLDIFVGIIELILAVGLIIAAMVLFANAGKL